MGKLVLIATLALLLILKIGDAAPIGNEENNLVGKRDTEENHLVGKRDTEENNLVGKRDTEENTDGNGLKSLVGKITETWSILRPNMVVQHWPMRCVVRVFINVKIKHSLIIFYHLYFITKL